MGARVGMQNPFVAVGGNGLYQDDFALFHLESVRLEQ